MENLFIYFLKANGLLVTFFLAYYFLLRKETFFNKNRWFLILGLVASVLLPLITFTKTVWIEPIPITYTPITYEPVSYVIANQIEESPFDWNSFFMYVYMLIAFVFLVKMIIELFSFFRIIKFGKRSKSDQTILIDTNQNTNPFSFFKYIVFNKEMFSEEELQHIISHENIHVKEKHSIDVLLGKVFCAIFWINPIMWFYRKEMLQNLEYIADNKASLTTENRINYQKTLLKVVTNQHPLTITNQFYQSLIKKRIVMLNTNQSNQRKSWKYALILPVLSAFMLLFQVETVAQVKEQIAAEAIQVIEVEINKNSTDAYISEQIRELKEDGIIVKISKIKRNKNGEITQLFINMIDDEGNIVDYESTSDEPIENIYIYKEFDGNKTIGIGAKSIFDNDRISDFKELRDRMNVEEWVNNFKEGYDKTSIPPTPPTPPNHPFENMMEAPTPPNFPDVPDLPSNLENKSEMKKYEKAMAVYEKKMKALEPQIQEFEKKIQVYENEMNSKEPEFKKFEKEMKIFENKMKVFEKEMKVYEENFKTEKSKPEIDKAKSKISYVIEVKDNPLNKISFTEFYVSNGDQIVVMENERIKIPEFPTTFLNKASIYFNDKKISEKEFVKMDYDLIKSIKVINTEGTTETFKPIKEIYFYSK